MKIIQWAAFGLGVFNLVAFLGAIFDPSHAKDAAWYGVAAPILLGIGFLVLVRRRRAALTPVVRTVTMTGIVVLAVLAAVIGNQVPGTLAATYEGEAEVGVSGDTMTSTYIANKAWVTSNTYKETTMTLSVTWVDDDQWQPHLSATLPTSDGDVHCATNDFRPWRRGTGQGQADTLDLQCDTYVRPNDLQRIRTVSLTEES